MRLPESEHTARPWRIHEIAHDFRLEDVWELPGRGGPGDFPRLVEMLATQDPSRSSSRVVRMLFAIRWKLGELLGWDEDESGVGQGVPSLRDRLPEDLRDAPKGPDTPDLPFMPLYMTDDEWAAEVANKTMHGVMHIGRVPLPGGEFRAHMAVLVKPNGAFGSAYMAAIRPFRYLLVYPALLREGERAWRKVGGRTAQASV